MDSEQALTGVPDLCRPFIGALPITGVTIAVMVPSGARVTLCSSDSVAARLDELQFELGEGPQWAAASAGTPVMIPDAASPDRDRWPVFGAAVAALDVGAVFCIPIAMGAVVLGVATLYSRLPNALTLSQQETAIAIASAIAGTAAREALRSVGEEIPEHETAATPTLRREVHQATGIILVQLNTTATIAYSRLQAYAFAQGRTVQAVAHDVIAGVITFEETTL